jgi:hypothetical protein
VPTVRPRADLVIVRRTLAVQPDGAAEGESHFGIAATGQQLAYMRFSSELPTRTMAANGVVAATAFTP